ncbi:MAG: copper transporter [Armatimonadetes bacterium]|nr:copper transporter [Armatimonadota bacterium]MDW8029423.1 copper transporter [Armatimonadota bacterium]
MVDIRIYISTLVAVLVFFGLGVLVGIGVTREPKAEQLYLRIERQLQKYREETAKELQKRDEQIRQLEREILSMQLKLKGSEQFIEKIAPVLVKDSLKFRNIALVSLTPELDGALTEKIRYFLQKAGANVPFKASFNPEAISQAEQRVWQEVATEIGLVVQGVSDEVIRSAVWKRIALAIRFGNSQDCWKVLNKFGWATVSGEVQTPIGSSVLLCSNQSPRDEQQIKAIDISFLQALRSAGVRVVVASKTETGSEVLFPYQVSNFPTIDHVDTPLGLLSLVAVLIGHQDHYGFNDSARRPFPEPEWFMQTQKPEIPKMSQ